MSFFKTQLSEFSDDLIFTCNLPPLRPAGEGWGEGGSTVCTNLLYLNFKSHPHPNLPPLDGGRDRFAVAATSSVGFARETNAKMDVHSAVV